MKHTESSLAAGDVTPGMKDASPGLRPNRLGVLAIAFFVVAAAAPIAAVVGASPVLFSAIGPATPVVYTVAAMLIALFSVGYLRMSRDITNAGGFVAYIATGLGTRWATGAAGVAVLTYVCLQAGLWAQFGVFANQLLTDLASIDLPVYIWVVLMLALTTLLTMKGVDASLKVLGVLIVGETCVIAALIASTIAQRGWGIFSFGGFTTEHLLAPGLGVSMLFAFTCFTSFEATVVFAEEARDPRKTIPRALYLVIAFVGFFYAISTWAISGAIGIDKIQTEAAGDPAGFIFQLASNDAGQWLSIAMQILIVTSFVAMLLGLSNMFARYLFALGRAGSLPRRLSTTSRTGTPTNAALSNGIAILVVITAFFAMGADPITTVYAWLVALGTAGFITILILASLAIIVYFARQRPRTEIWATTITPILSCLTFILIGYLTISNYDALLGGSGGIAIWLLPLIPASFTAGLIVASFNKSISYNSPGI